MLLRLVAHARLALSDQFLAKAAGLDIVVLVGAERHVIQRHVGQHRQRVGQRLVEFALARLAVLDEAFDLRDLGLQLLRPRHVLVAHGIADFLGSGVAALLLGLQFRQVVAPRLVPGDQVVDGRLRGLGIGRTLPQRLHQCLRVFANPLDVEHGAILIECLRRKPQEDRMQGAGLPLCGAKSESGYQGSRGSSRHAFIIR